MWIIEQLILLLIDLKKKWLGNIPHLMCKLIIVHQEHEDDVWVYLMLHLLCYLEALRASMRACVCVCVKLKGRDSIEHSVSMENSVSGDKMG